MWFVSKALFAVGKVIAPFYYIGKEKDCKFTLLKFDNAIFLARTNSTDALVLHEIWKLKCYDAASVGKGLVVDIGAHIGGYTIKAAKSGATVISYEAAPDNYELLKANMRLNQCKKAKAYNIAVSSKTGTLTLHTDAKLSSIHTVCSDDYFKQSVTVPATDLHGIFVANKLAKIDVLKIDTEGAEYDILLPAKKQDLLKIKTIILEYHDFMGHGHSCKEIKSFLEANGFTVSYTSPSWQRAVFKAGNMLAVRNPGKR